MLASAARIWRHREKIEWEAADAFARHADELSALGLPERLVRMARDAAAEEAQHAELCRALVDRFEPGLPALSPRLGVALGPAHLSRRDRALYASVALCCVTETLSVALLMEMRSRATDPLVRSTVHRILTDEVAHSRLGWAHLAAEARTRDVQWLEPYVGDMLATALATDVEPLANAGVAASAWVGLGILPRHEVRAICRRAERDVIAPGLAELSRARCAGRTF